MSFEEPRIEFEDGAESQPAADALRRLDVSHIAGATPRVADLRERDRVALSLLLCPEPRRDGP